MKRKRIKKYQAGGSTAFTAGAGFSGTGLGSGIGAFGGMAGGLIEGADMKDGYMSTGGALGSGALKGASMGAAFGPAGMLIGAGLGAAGGLLKKKQVNEAEDARLATERDEERLRASMENQMKHQQMNQVLDQFPVKGNNTPRFEKGGDTDPVHPRAKTPEELMAMQANANQHGTIRQYNPSRWELFKEALHEHNMQEDSTFENMAEIVDFTGTASWDDAYRANVNAKSQNRTYNADEILDTMGAVPIFGKYKAGVGLGKSASKKLAHSFKETGEAALGYAKSGSNVLNRVDGIEDEVGFMNKFAMGGKTGTPGPYAGLDNSTRANLRANGIHPMATQFADVDPNLFSALGQISHEDYTALQNSARGIKEQAAGLKGQGVGATLDFVSGLDMTALKPLREQAGMSKAELLDTVLGQTNLGWGTRKAASLALRTKDFAKGGTTMGPGYEVEGGEMMQTKGETPQTYGQGGVSQVASQEYEVKGPKHSNGGVQANDNQGARVYSDKLTVDSTLLSKLSKL